jgi:hypothetical protein
MITLLIFSGVIALNDYHFQQEVQELSLRWRGSLHSVSAENFVERPQKFK